MKRLLCLCLGLLLFFPSLLALTSLRKSTPTPERLGYKPSFEVTYLSSLEYRHLLSELIVYDVVFYYGSILDRPKERPDYGMIAKYIDDATRLNSYNIDAYYFAQAVLTWDVGMVKEMNRLLERGAKSRNWDYYLPFFLGFNYSHFLGDYKKGAQYYERSARLNPQMTFLPNLVARLYNQADKTEEAIQYLKVVYHGTSNQAVRSGILLRITALETIQFLENAVRKYEVQAGHAPVQLTDLVDAGILKSIPPDPYGGTFYYDRSDARVKTSSNMVSKGVKNVRN